MTYKSFRQVLGTGIKFPYIKAGSPKNIQKAKK